MKLMKKGKVMEWFNQKRYFQQCKQPGFSLIELMIVILIIGLLSSFAIPHYNDYVVRAKITELMMAAQSAKLAVAEALITGTAKDQIDNAKIGFPVINNKDKIKDLIISKGVVSITGNSGLLGIDPQKTLKIVLIPEDSNGFISWKCSVDPIELKKYVPENCRNAVPQ